MLRAAAARRRTRPAGRRGPVAGADRGDRRRPSGPPCAPGGVLARRAALGSARPRRPGAVHLPAGHPDGAVGGLDDRRGAELAEPGQQHVERDVADHHGRGDPAQPQRRRPGSCTSSASAASSSLRRNDSAAPTRSVPKRAGDVVDEVGQRLRHRGARGAGEEVVHLGGRPAGRRRRGVPSRLGEAVDGRAAPGLHVGDAARGRGPARCSSGPGATAVRSACSSTWSTGVGQQRGERGGGRVRPGRPRAAPGRGRTGRRGR